jgi:hypothetical protein
MLADPRSGKRSDVYCRTVYYINLETRKLALHERRRLPAPASTRPGTSASDAAVREHKQFQLATGPFV